MHFESHAMQALDRLRSFTGHPRGCWHAALALSLGASLGHAHAADACSVVSPRNVAPIVELYTSEGCNSCPPADRWLSKLKADPTVVALAFHVDYWDRLGWKDRFAKAAFTERQALQRTSNGARFSYTPQVVVDGRDRKNWPQIQTASPSASPAVVDVEITLARDESNYTATIVPSARTPHRLAAYWAVTEHEHVTTVKAGENVGVTLQHDYVVRDYAPVAAWEARAGAAKTLQFSPANPADATHPRSVNLVVVDAASGRPVQAIKLGC